MNASALATPTPDPQGASLDATAAQLTLAVLRLNRLLRQSDRGGLTPSLSAALASVARHGTPTLGELAASEHVTPASMTPIIKKLESLELVARVADPTDGRVTRVRLTDAGQRQLDDNRTRRTTWIKTRLGALEDDELARLERALGVLTALTAVEPEGAPA